MRSVSIGTFAGLAFLAISTAGCGGGGGGPGNRAPALDAPTGALGPVGVDPDFTAQVTVGDALDFSVVATDRNARDTITVVATVTGGTLTAAQAGFTTSFPTFISGTSPQTLSAAGTAAAGGRIILSIDVDDGRNKTDQITLTIDINSPPVIGPPAGPGTVTGTHPDYATSVNTGDSLAFDVTAADADSADSLSFSVAATGGSLTPTAAGFTTVPVSATGTSPQTLSFDGTAASGGDVVFTFDVDDGMGGTDQVTYTVVVNSSPLIGAPTGPGVVGGTRPSYTATVALGASLFFNITATDADTADVLTFTATRTGGTLTAAQAGFNETFPAQVTGTSPRTLTFTGAAAMLGDIEITFDLDDGQGATDSIVHTIRFNSPPAISAPTGPGGVLGSDPSYSSVVNGGDNLAFTVTATDPDPGDSISFTASVTGGTLTPSQIGLNETFPVSSIGPSPLVLSFTGGASMEGTIEITFVADDGRGGTDSIVHTIRVNSPPQIGPPTGPGAVTGTDPAYSTNINIGDPLDFGITATDLNGSDTLTLSAVATGGSLTSAQAGFSTFPATSVGTSPLTAGFAGTAAQAGDIIISFTVLDGQGGGDAVTFAITINSPPQVLAPTGPGVVTGTDPVYASIINPGDPLDFSVTATDLNLGDTLTFAATVSGGTLSAAQAGFNETFPRTTVGTSPVTIALTGTAGMEGTIALTFDVGDGWGATDQITFTIRINSPPVIGTPTGPGTVTGTDPSYSTTITIGNPIGFAVTATDPNGTDTLTFDVSVSGGTLTPVQAGIVEPIPDSVAGVSPQTFLFNGTAALAGTLVLTFTVDDGQGATDVITHTIDINTAPRVLAPNGPGTVGGADPNYATTITVGDPLDFQVSADDADGDSLTFTGTVTGGTLSAAQAGFVELFPVSDSGLPPRTLSLTGTASMLGNIRITFDVDDGRGGTDSITHTITIINTAPVVQMPTGPGAVGGTDPVYTTTINPGDSLVFDVTATDVNPGDTLTFTATVTGGTLSAAQAGFNEVFPASTVGVTPEVLSFTGTAGLEGVIEITFDVDDGLGGTDLITLTITINSAPVIGTPTGPGTVTGSDPSWVATVNLGASLNFDVTATDLNPTDTLTFAVDATGGSLTPAAAGFNEALPFSVVGASPRTLFLTGTAAQAGDITFTFDVDDGQGATDVITLTININTPPQVLAPSGPGPVGGSDPAYTATVVSGDPIDFQVSADDADGDSILFTGQVTGGTLTAAQAGIVEPFPVSDSGLPPRTISLTGTAGLVGEIVITFDADDGRGGTDLITHTITIIPDTTPPADIMDLSAAYSGVADTIDLSWTAPGDDGMSGTATAYVLKFSTSPITSDAEFLAATTYPQAWSPLTGGSTETKLIDLTLVGYGWYLGAGYFSIKAEDEVPNSSGFSGDLGVNTDLTTTFPATTFSYGTLDFQNPSSANFDYTNTATLVDLVISTIALTGDPEFAITAGGGAPVTVTPGNTRTITVRYLPLAPGSHTATLDVTHNDSGKASPYVISLAGDAVNAVPQVTSGTFNPHPTPGGAPVTVTVEVTDNNCDLPAVNDIVSVVIDLSAVGGPPAQPLVFVTDNGPKVAIYDFNFPTSPIPGVYDLPVTVTDVAGASATRTLSHVVTIGTVLDVPTPTYPTIQDAINAAAPSGDVVLVQDGTYAGAGNKNLFTSGKEVVVMSQNGAATTIIDCQGTGRGFFFNNTGETATTVILGFTIQNGAASGIYCLTDASPTIRDCTFLNDTSGTNGGGLLLDGALVAPRLAGCTFSGNTVPGVQLGGGIYATGGSSLTVEWCTFDSNGAYHGGAISTDSPTSIGITDCTFTGNTASGGGGGAVYLIGGTSTIDRCTFDGNQALTVSGGGGALGVDGDCTVTATVFRNNTSGARGGAVSSSAAGVTANFVDCDFTDNQSPDGAAIELGFDAAWTFTGCTFAGNLSAGRGGAVTLQGAISGPEFSDCLFAGNTAGGEGGAIYTEVGNVITPLRLLNSTVSGNDAAVGGGLYVLSGEIVMTDAIIWGNTDFPGSADEVFVDSASGATLTVSFCDIDDSPGSLDDAGLRINPPAGFVPGLLGNIAVDPLFATGPRGDFYLSWVAAGELADSPCVDVGSDTALNLGLNTKTTRTDRVLDTGVVDMGVHFVP